MSEIRNFFSKDSHEIFLIIKLQSFKERLRRSFLLKVCVFLWKRIIWYCWIKIHMVARDFKKNNTVARENVKNVTIATTYIYHFVPHIMNYYCAKSQTNRLKFRFYMIFFCIFFTFKMAAMTTGSRSSKQISVTWHPHRILNFSNALGFQYTL